MDCVFGASGQAATARVAGTGRPTVVRANGLRAAYPGPLEE